MARDDPLWPGQETDKLGKILRAKAEEVPGYGVVKATGEAAAGANQLKKLFGIGEEGPPPLPKVDIPPMLASGAGSVQPGSAATNTAMQRMAMRTPPLTPNVPGTQAGGGSAGGADPRLMQMLAMLLAQRGGTA